MPSPRKRASTDTSTSVNGSKRPCPAESVIVDDDDDDDLFVSVWGNEDSHTKPTNSIGNASSSLDKGASGNSSLNFSHECLAIPGPSGITLSAHKPSGFLPSPVTNNNTMAPSITDGRGSLVYKTNLQILRSMFPLVGAAKIKSYLDFYQNDDNCVAVIANILLESQERKTKPVKKCAGATATPGGCSTLQGEDEHQISGSAHNVSNGSLAVKPPVGIEVRSGKNKLVHSAMKKCLDRLAARIDIAQPYKVVSDTSLNQSRASSKIPTTSICTSTPGSSDVINKNSTKQTVNNNANYSGASAARNSSPVTINQTRASTGTCTSTQGSPVVNKNCTRQTLNSKNTNTSGAGAARSSSPVTINQTRASTGACTSTQGSPVINKNCTRQTLNSKNTNTSGAGAARSSSSMTVDRKNYNNMVNALCKHFSATTSSRTASSSNATVNCLTNRLNQLRQGIDHDLVAVRMQMQDVTRSMNASMLPVSQLGHNSQLPSTHSGSAGSSLPIHQPAVIPGQSTRQSAPSPGRRSSNAQVPSKSSVTTGPAQGRSLQTHQQQPGVIQVPLAPGQSSSQSFPGRGRRFSNAQVPSQSPVATGPAQGRSLQTHQQQPDVIQVPLAPGQSTSQLAPSPRRRSSSAQVPGLPGPITVVPGQHNIPLQPTVVVTSPGAQSIRAKQLEKEREERLAFGNDVEALCKVYPDADPDFIRRKLNEHRNDPRRVATVGQELAQNPNLSRRTRTSSSNVSSKDVTWFWETEEGKLIAFSRVDNLVLEGEYRKQNGQKVNVKFPGSPHTCSVDFMRWIMVDHRGKTVELVRIPSNGEPDRSAQLTTGQGRSVVPQTYPEEWQAQSKKAELITVRLGSAEFLHVEEKLKETLTTVTVTKIERVQNQWLYRKFTVQRSLMTEKNGRNKVNEMELFHGTKLNRPEQIWSSEDGFDMRLSADGMWGRGMYFAVNASYCHQGGYAYISGVAHNCVSRQVFLAHVLTGDTIHMNPDRNIKRPPENGSTGYAHDSIHGVTFGHQIFVLYKLEQAYPAYLITYTDKQ